jgi:hypothetical protein
MRSLRRWQAVLIVVLGCISPGCSARRVQSGAPLAAAPAVDTGCCGPITPAGQQLLQVLLSLDVEHHWLENRRVYWETGNAKGPEHISSKPDTHCSAFAAAAGLRLGVYMLRPPEHSQNFLASAQGRWFPGEEARRKGWRQVMTSEDAQRLANQGELVVLNFINPVPGQHGHIAVVRPMVKSREALEAEGPETMQAGKTNFADGNAVRSFHSHAGAWPAQVTMWAHRTRLQDGLPALPAGTDSDSAEAMTQPAQQDGGR